MNIVCAFVFPGHGFINQAVKFLQTFHDHPAGIEHRNIIICNGVKATDEIQFLFGSLPNVGFIEHDNSGLDIGAFQFCARTVPADMMVFFGVHSYFRGPGWLKRMADVFVQYGKEHLYGSTGSQGDARFNVYPHARTNAFWCDPKLVNDCPLKVTHNELRYPWEHGSDSLSQWVIKNGQRVWIVGWDCVYPLNQCDSLPGGFHRDNQHNVMVGDRLTMNPYFPVE